MSEFSDFIAQFNEFLTTFFIILLLIVFFFGQNYQGWFSSRQIRKALKSLNKWKKYGINLIQNNILPISQESITDREITEFINKMLDFFVITPTQMDPPIFEKLRYIESYREERYNQLIRQFLPKIEESSLTRVSSLLNATTEIHNIHKMIRHKLFIGEKTKSHLFLMTSASETTQLMIKARAYRTALDSFMGNLPIGDSIGPMSVNEFVIEIQKEKKGVYPELQNCSRGIFSCEISYKERKCICLRAKGPDSIVGNIGDAVENIFTQIQRNNQKIVIVITIDAITRLEGEKIGAVAQGLGIAVGGYSNNMINKYQIETLCLKQNPPVPFETIVCRESVEEALLPMSEPIKVAIPKIIRLIKQIIRSQTKPNDIVLIVGVGNAIGVNGE